MSGHRQGERLKPDKGATPPIYDDEGLISVSKSDPRIQLHTDAEVRAATLAIGNRKSRRRKAAKLRAR